DARINALIHLGAGRAAGGDATGAVETFARAHFLIGQLPETERNEAHNLASARAAAGDYKGATETAEAYLPEDSLVHVNIAYALAERGKFAEALELAAKMKTSEWWKGNLLRWIASAQTERGHS